MSNKQEFVVPDLEKNERLDVFLVRVLENMSRSHIQKLISDGDVKVNGREVKANYKVQSGEEIAVSIREAQKVEIVPEEIALDVIFEDEYVIVVNKQRGMVVHPAVGNYSGTLVNALLEHCEDLSGINGMVRPGIVHRLDKDTSGVMVAAKNDLAHISLTEQIKNRTASRRYLAIVHGNIKEDQGRIHAPIGRHSVDRKKMAVTFENSKEAITNFHVLERFGKFTFVECKLETGRTHQIRVHMSYIGHAVVGDPKYGPERCSFSIKGQALHSTELTFTHPATGETMVFHAPLPDDMNQILAKLRK